MAPLLKQRIREAFVTGELWPLSAEQVWASVADGKHRCTVCLERITHGVAYELSSPAGTDLVVHYACYVLWRHESALLEDFVEGLSGDEGAEDTQTCTIYRDGVVVILAGKGKVSICQ